MWVTFTLLKDDVQWNSKTERISHTICHPSPNQNLSKYFVVTIEENTDKIQ